MEGPAPGADGAGRDALSVLHDDHLRLLDLFERVEVAGDGVAPELFDEMVRAVSVHDAVERELLYPTVGSASGEGSDLAKDALNDHVSLATSMQRLQKLGFNDAAAFHAELGDAIYGARRHITKEEAEIFPVLSASLTTDMLVELGGRLRSARDRAPTRPHPHNPRSGTGAKVVDRLVAPLDRLRNQLGGR